MKYQVIAIIDGVTEENETDTGRGLVLLNHTILAEKKTDSTVELEPNYNPLEEVREIVIAMVERSTDEYQPLEEGRKQSSIDEGSESTDSGKQDPVKRNVRGGAKKGGKKN